MTWPAIDVSTVMLALGLALMALILLRRSHGYIRGTPTRHQAAIEKMPRPLKPPRPSPTSTPPELVRWQVEMHETARDLTAELDSKISILRQLLLMAADERTKLEECIARGEQLGRHPAVSAATPQPWDGPERPPSPPGETRRAVP